MANGRWAMADGKTGERMKANQEQERAPAVRLWKVVYYQVIIQIAKEMIMERSASPPALPLKGD
jgi:hypothetical protein